MLIVMLLDNDNPKSTNLIYLLFTINISTKAIKFNIMP